MILSDLDRPRDNQAAGPIRSARRDASPKLAPADPAPPVTVATEPVNVWYTITKNTVVAAARTAPTTQAEQGRVADGARAQCGCRDSLAGRARWALFAHDWNTALSRQILPPVWMELFP